MEEKITIHFRDLSLHEGLKRILESMNHYLLFDRDERLTNVVIIAKKIPGQVRPKGRIAAQQKQAHKSQVAQKPPTSWEVKTPHSPLTISTY